MNAKKKSKRTPSVAAIMVITLAGLLSLVANGKVLGRIEGDGTPVVVAVWHLFSAGLRP
jgi:hypothetical protein